MHNFLDDRDQVIEDETPEDDGAWDFDRERDNQLQEDLANGVW